MDYWTDRLTTGLKWNRDVQKPQKRNMTKKEKDKKTQNNNNNKKKRLKMTQKTQNDQNQTLSVWESW